MSILEHNAASVTGGVTMLHSSLNSVLQSILIHLFLVFSSAIFIHCPIFESILWAIFFLHLRQSTALSCVSWLNLGESLTSSRL